MISQLEQPKDDSSDSNVGLVESLISPDYRKATFLALFIACSNALSGINYVNIYCITIFESIQKQTGNYEGLTPS